MEKLLTIGMPVYDDYNGVFFTLQNLRLQAKEHLLLNTIEFIVIDNNPDSPQGQSVKKLCNATNTKYIPYKENRGTAAAKNQVFNNAKGKWVCCMDSHVILNNESFEHLIAFILHYRHQRNKENLYHGLLVLDRLTTAYNRMDPIWRGGMYGIWGSQIDIELEDMIYQTEIPMHGMGFFLCHRDTWPGFNNKFIGFGGEEGYIHEKIKQQGGKTMCLNNVKWLHRFHNQSTPTTYHNAWEERIHNYYVGFKELGRDDMWENCKDHFHEFFKPETVDAVSKKLEENWNIDFSKV